MVFKYGIEWDTLVFKDTVRGTKYLHYDLYSLFQVFPWCSNIPVDYRSIQCPWVSESEVDQLCLSIISKLTDNCSYKCLDNNIDSLISKCCFVVSIYCDLDLHCKSLCLQRVLKTKYKQCKNELLCLRFCNSFVYTCFINVVKTIMPCQIRVDEIIPNINDSEYKYNVVCLENISVYDYVDKVKENYLELIFSN